MACGTPVLAFDAGGTRDAVKHGENGWLAPAGDAAGLAEGLTALFADGSLRHQYGTAARRTIAAEFEAGLQATRFASLYADLAAERRARG